jgi:hypothetical protein
MNRTLLVFVLGFVLLFNVACNSWPTIIATAQALSAVTSIFFPGVGALSSLAVQLLQQAEAAAQAYQANKNDGTAAAYVAAIQKIETQLPADCDALNIPAADKTKVQAGVNVILVYVEALAAQVPATQHVVAQARTARAAKLGVYISPTPPKPLTRAQIKAKWKADVCGGEATCTALVN